MNHSALTPVFTALRISLHVLFVGLTVFVIARAVLISTESRMFDRTSFWVIAIGTLILVVYAAAAWLPRSRQRRSWTTWLVVLVVLCLVQMVLTADAAYLVFPLFFLALHLITRPWSVIVVAALTACSIIALAWHTEWSIGVIVGPVIGAGVAVAIGLGYQALFHEAHDREALIHDLVETRQQLAATEREAGMLAERARLAREIHDTVAQGLASIQLLLHAVERADENHPAIDQVKLARETAATNLAETRRFIRELTPPALEEQSLEGALRRLAEHTTQTTRIPVHVTISGDPLPVPMQVETALLRIAQGSLANVAQHAHATQAEVTLSYMDDSVSLDIVDDGRGFDTATTASATPGTHASFGFAAIRQRAAQLGGRASVESRMGRGTAVAVSIPVTPSDGHRA